MTRFASTPVQIERRVAGENVWLYHAGADEQAELIKYSPQMLNYEVLESEAAVGRTMFDELVSASDKLATIVRARTGFTGR